MAVWVESYAADLNGVKRGRGLGVSELPQTRDKGGWMVDLIHGKISEQRGDFTDNGENPMNILAALLALGV